jgi:hypothetical protein
VVCGHDSADCDGRTQPRKWKEASAHRSGCLREVLCCIQILDRQSGSQVYIRLPAGVESLFSPLLFCAIAVWAQLKVETLSPRINHKSSATEKAHKGKPKFSG